MRILKTTFLLITLLLLPRYSFANDNYPLGPDSQKQPGVAHGLLTQFKWTSKIFPGTERDCWVYAPAQVDPLKPSSVMIFQDGGGFQGVDGQFRVPIVFDNLIAKKQMPITIGIFLNPGVMPASKPDSLPRYNRSFEYDALSDRYAKFLLEEIMPEVSKKYKLSAKPEDRGLCGASSGGICSFVAAWNRPDQFSKVISFVGSFTNLRGGHNLPPLIRKFEPKPLRVYLQDGTADQDIYGGSWFQGNSEMASALKFAGYDYHFEIGDGGHSGTHGAMLLPDALRWIWRDYPAPISAAIPRNTPVNEVIIPGESWQTVTVSSEKISAITSVGDGSIYAALPALNHILQVRANGEISPRKEDTPGVDALALDPEGILCVSQAQNRTVSTITADGKVFAVEHRVNSAGLAISAKSDLYIADAARKRIVLRTKTNKTMSFPIGETIPAGITLTPDQSLLIVTSASPGVPGCSFWVQPDGSLTNMQEYFDLYIPYGSRTSGSAGMATDKQGRLYVATSSGVQVLDQAGRVIAILDSPLRGGTVSITFGGAKRDWLYAVSEGELFKRHLKTTGVYSFEPPIKPPEPHL